MLWTNGTLNFAKKVKATIQVYPIWAHLLCP